MVHDILDAPDNGFVVLTSGGTESIEAAVKTARDWARAECPEVKNPKMVLPYSAHPAFNKSAAFFGLEVVRVPQGNDCRADASAIGDLAPLPDPEAGLVIITSTSLDLFAVSEALNRRGYPHGMTREPPGLHFTMNPLEDMRPVDGLLEAMREAVDDVRTGRVASSGADGSYI